MKTIRRFGVMTLTLAALAGAIPQVASASGSIRSITAYDPETGHREYGPDDLIRIGETLAFKVRLLNYNTNCTSSGGRDNPWSFRLRTGADPVFAQANLPKMGLWISGHKRLATLKSISLADRYYTDIVFEYKVQSGDMALPVKFCNIAGTSELANSEDQQYLLENVGPMSYWELKDEVTGTSCEFSFGSQYLVPSSTDNFEYPPPGWTSADEVRDYDLSQAQIYVQTVDFDSSSDPWRTVYENKTTTVEGTLPTLLIPGGASEESTVYLWTEDSDVAILASGGERVYHALTPDKSGYKDYTVYTANIVKETNFTFKVKGVRGAAGQTTTIYLSTTPTNIYNSAGTRLVNFVSQTIAVTNQANPEVVFELEPAAITCNSAYGTAKALMRVTVDAFTNDITVALNPTIGGVALAPGMINISTSADGALNPFSGTLTFPARPSMDSDPVTYNYYVFGLGFVTNDTYAATSQQILFTPTISGDGGAFAAVDSFNLTVAEANPVIALGNVTDDGIDAVAQEDYPITLSLADSYANVNSTAGYQIWWKRSATTAWTLLESGVKPVDGELNFNVKYNSGGTYTTSIRVIGPDGLRSTEDLSFAARVASAKNAYLYVDKDDDDVMPRQYYEGDKVQRIQVILQNWKNEESDSIYAYLQPLDGAENYISAAKFLTTTANATGLAIKPDATNTVANAQFTTLDGTEEGYDLNFNIVFSTAKAWADVTAGNTLYTFEADTIYVYNVAPEFEFVTMTGGSQMRLGDGSETQNADQGLTKTFTWSALDVDADMPTIRTKWTVTDPYGAVAVEQTLVGNPSTLSFQYAFMQMGVYTVKVQMQDKDMGTREWSEFNFKVSVGEAPRTIFLFPDDSDGISSRYSYNENAVVAGLDDWFQVGLSTAAKDPLVIKVTRAPYSGTTGIFDLSGADSEGAVYVTIPAGQTIGSISQVSLAELDGTQSSAKSSGGYEITATVTNTNLNADGIPYNEIYAPSTVRVNLANVPPAVTVSPSPRAGSTNSFYHAVVSANELLTIEWEAEDVDADVADNLELKWTGLTAFTYTSGSSTSASGAIQFSFASGSHTVTLVVKDKDKGESETFTWVYVIEPSKDVQVYPLGPYRSGQSDMSREYLSAYGLGKGRVFAEGASPTSVYNFRHSYSYLISDTMASIWAWGYRVGDVDDGSLDVGHDVALDPNGRNDSPAASTLTSFYRYPDTVYDSFFYAWINNVTGEDGGSTVGTTYPNPQIGTNGFANKEFALPTETTGDEETPSYQKMLIEAVFSREYRPGDNLGDINQDGVPDVYALKLWTAGRLYELVSGGSSDSEGGGLTTAGADTVDVSAYNDDEDYLPAPTSTGDTLIPNVVANWATTGEKFTADYELRGFGPGLNYREGADGKNPNVRGTWISDPDFTPAETNAYIRYCLSIGTDTNTVDIFSAEFMATVQWSPENRTDPTVADTDGDGFPDGYEYYFWYRALVGDENGVQMTGSRFNPDNIAQGIEITPEEIMAAFNPTVKSSVGVTARDTDGDGLTDLEELAIGTNPLHWDTDGDGISDLYEVIWALNPLDAEDGTGNPDGDFMASWESEKTWAVVTVPGSGIYAINEAETILNGFVAGSSDAEGSLDASSADVTFEGIPVFWYGADGTIPVPKNRMAPLTNFVSVVVAQGTSNSVVRGKALRLIHDQVYNSFDFDPRTGWYVNKKGYVADRWVPATGSDAAAFTDGAAGLATNTVAFTSLDEYLLCKYRKETGAPTGKIATPDSSARSKVANMLMACCTAPNMPKSGVTYGDLEEEFGFENVYGADTDGDGVPDGWELYVGANPNVGSDGSLLEDKDLLTLVEEYAGTDSCNAYSNTPSILANHPGVNSGWYNKFFPTNPKNEDTDGDGVLDSQEGTTWKGSFYAGRKGGDQESFQTTFTFIYGPNDGMPEGDDGSRCIRGGGLNPCTVDTDLDLLPDGWERQFAGIVFSAAGQPEGNSLSDDVVKLFRISDGLDSISGESLATPVGYYISGGMDGTYGPTASQPGDAFTAFNEKTGSKDPRTGTRRDCDWDHDGLENFQEYLVQTLRHLRYDDSETPLMGSQLFFDDTGSYRLPFKKCIPFQAFDGTAFYDVCRKSGFLATSAWKFRELGYFARPPHEWDRVALNTEGNELCKNYEDYEGVGYRILLPPKGLSYKASISNEERLEAEGYVSTDPRRWDTDDDGMDDYWELFHGLNPLLGSASQMGMNDVIAAQYGGVPNAWANAWTGWPLLMPSQPPFDAMKYPWMIGTPECDADGDGIRNAEEGLFVNITTPSPKHTDPTPLWMTDKTSPASASFTSQYYRMDPYVDSGDMGLADLYAYPWGWASGDSVGASEGQVANWMFSFEENEGYDTDGDRQADNAEGVKTVENASDPLVFSDPSRRQALWLPGWHTSTVSGMEIGSAVVSRGGSDAMQKPMASSYDMLRQFTVEAWVRPEKLDAEQVILERVSNYGASTLSNNTDVIRANFRIGVTADNKYYAEFEGNTADSGVQRLVGTEVEAGVWTHLAVTFDGSTFAMYVNDEESPVAKAENISLIPANGIVIIKQEAGAATPVQSKGYTAVPCAFVIGARATAAEALTLTKDTTWDAFGDYYTGWIDEVRVWDGARTGAEIAADSMVRYSFNDVKSMRQAVYQSWVAGATRNDVVGKVLPAELLQHYDFSTLAGAMDAATVMQEPLAFTAKVLDNVRIDGKAADVMLADGDLNVGWWYALPVHSDVYYDYHLVPWIQNTCAHLPFMDGSTPDSMYWSENFGGLTPGSHSFPNAANPYAFYNYLADRAAYLKRLESFAEGENSAYGAFANLYAFQLRNGFVGTSDLLPLGGAFAKRTDELWDGYASDAWTQTGLDSDADGLPDWWEELVAAGGNADVEYLDDEGNPLVPGNIDWSTMVWRNGVKMTLAQAYLRDLADGMVYVWDDAAGTGTVSIDEAYAAKVDGDGNGIADWWEDLYAIYGEDVTADHDNDQLSNFAEYLIGECFTRANGVNRKSTYDSVNDIFKTLDPRSMFSYRDEGQIVPDYFRRVGSLYLGELFSDHDFMEDWWELYIGNPSYASRFHYDARVDADDDGWSNFAECRHSLWKALTQSDMIDRWLDDGLAYVACHPEPAVGVKLSYYGNKDVSGAPLVVRVSPDNIKIRDAVFTVPGAGTAAQVGSVYIGPYRANAVMHGHMSPGSILSGSSEGCKFYRVILSSDAKYVWSYEWYSENASTALSYGGAGRNRGMGTMQEYLSEASKYPHITLVDTALAWQLFATSAPSAPGSAVGQIIYASSASTNGVATATSGSIGTVNYLTGEFEIDAAKLAAAEGTTADLDVSVFKVDYSYRMGVEWPQTVYLSQPGSGYVREGGNVVSAFFDLDGNGQWTAGEPYGVSPTVNVGWWKATTEIELTDTNPSMARFDLSSIAGGSSSSGSSSSDASGGMTDRDANGYLYANATASNSVAALPPANSLRIRVVRDRFNGESYINSEAAFREVVLDRTFNASLRPLLTEADLVAEGLYDLDWGTVMTAFSSSRVGSSARADLASVTYRVFVGNGDIVAPDDDTDVLAVKFVNVFEPLSTQTPTTPLWPVGAVVDAGRPTFKWRHNNTIGKDYPAFRLRVYKADGTTLVYDSGVRKAPPRQASGMYVWTAPLYANMVTDKGQIFATTNNYQWAVSMLDAKFTAFSSSETKKSFRLECSGVSGGISDYGSIEAKIKYFGPGKVSTAAKSSLASLIRVQAFDTPDFTGDPAGEAYVSDVSDISSTTGMAVNARIIGLEPGTYYVRAFIDTNGDGKRQVWESWGYANYVGTESASVYNPKGLTVESGSPNVPCSAIYMEDCDSDNDGFPDVYEWDQNGNLTSVGPATGNTFFTEVNPDLLKAMKAYTSLNLETGGSSLAPVFRLMSAATSSVSGLKAANALLSSNPSSVENATDIAVVIESFSLEDGMTVRIDPAVSAASGGLLAVSTAPVAFNLELRHKATLADADWETVATVPLSLKANETLTLTGDDLAVLREKIAEMKTAGTAGFFKVVLAK